MRNLAKYPITLTEIEDTLLEMAKEEADSERVGNMRPLLLEAAAKIVRRTGFVVDDL